MRYWGLIFVALLAIGCSAGPRAQREIALLRAEMVDLEDQYFMLKSRYRDETGHDPDFNSNAGHSSESWSGGDSYVESDNCVECGQIHDPQVQYDHPLMIEGSTRSNQFTDPTQNTERLNKRNTSPAQPEIQLPKENVEEIEPIPDSHPKDGTAKGQSSNYARRPPNKTKPVNLNGRSAGTNNRPLVSSGSRIENIILNADSVSGYDNNGLAGDDGVDINIELQFSHHDSIGSPGEFTISVIDPEQPADKQRLGLWKFGRHQTDSMVSGNQGRPAFSTKLPWQNGSAENENLLLFVRLKTDDGRTLEKSMQFNVATAESRNESGKQDFKTNGDNVEEFEGDPPITSPNRATQNGPRNWRPVR